MCEKKMNEKKNEKKKLCSKGAAETELGYCPNCVTIQWKLYRDIAFLGVQIWPGGRAVSRYKLCIVVGAAIVSQ